ncbi:MAG: DUF7302 family protein [Nocardioidaceae bacterium]
MSAVRVKVNDGFAVYDGEKQVGGGSVVEVDQHLADQLLASGAAEPAKDTPKKR